MLYTIGYARLTPKSLAALAEKLEAIVTDCRAKPTSKNPVFRRPALHTLLGSKYEWWGDRLGGWPPGVSNHSTTNAGISELRHASSSENRLLICVEEHPKDCHRHTLICGPHFPEAVHIFRDYTFTAETLNAATATGASDFETGDLGDLFGAH